MQPKDKNTVTVDFGDISKMQRTLKSNDTDINLISPKDAAIVRGAVAAVTESSRSKASIVREIEKVTKFTEADIRASWKFKENKAK